MHATLAEAQHAEMLEEQRQEAAQRRLAFALVESAEQWQDTLRLATSYHLMMGLLIATSLSLLNAELVAFAITFLWFGVLLKIDARPSCCRTVGGIACILAMIAMLTMPGPGVLATPFFALPLCRNSSSGGGALFGLHPAGSGLTSAAACAGTTSAENAPLDVPLALHSLDADRAYRPVVLLPAGSSMSLMLTVLDVTGNSLYLPTKLELGPGDTFPWDRALAKPAAGALSTKSTTAAATTESSSSSSFAASTRRRLLSLETSTTPTIAAAPPTIEGRITTTTVAAAAPPTIEGRRLRGIGMGGMRLGGMGGGGGFGSFTRGTGGFGSPHRGISQGPSAFGRRGGGGVTSAMGGPRFTQAGAVGRA